MRGTGLPSPGCLRSGVFEIAEASGVRTGTKIIIHLKSDCREFASEARVQGEWEPGPLGTCGCWCQVSKAPADGVIEEVLSGRECAGSRGRVLGGFLGLAA